MELENVGNITFVVPNLFNASHQSNMRRVTCCAVGWMSPMDPSSGCRYLEGGKYQVRVREWWDSKPRLMKDWSLRPETCFQSNLQRFHYYIGKDNSSNTQTSPSRSRVAQRKRAGPITQRFQIITLTKIFKKMVRLNWIHHFDIVDNPTF